MDTSTLDTPTLSDAEPLTVYGSGELLFKVEPSDGSVIEDVGVPASAVVYENEYAADIGFPYASVTAVVTLMLYAVVPVWPLVVKTACAEEQLESVQPGLVEVIFVVLTVEQLTASFQLIVTVLFNATPDAPFVGTVEVTLGPVWSMVTALPAAGVSILLEESVALL